MMNCRLPLILLVILSFQTVVRGQESVADTTKSIRLSVAKLKPLIIPGILMGYGFAGIENHYLQSFDREVKEEVNEHIDENATIDDFLQYTPFLSVYALNAAGVKGKHNFRDRTVILASSYLMMSVSVSSIKSIAKVERPDKSSNNSFPSGHTATAFMGAEFLYQEYKDVSIWYGIAGYAVASGTGFYRIYNNRHWVTDVAAGAGIGILSTKIAYWINPYITNKLFKKRDKTSGAILYPYYNGEQVGLGIALNL
ncbi:MAG: phosphatase PAP2 family protein [Prolixibacteraceae bacterium]|nr:phosphatase PAP2 family protein [Prolixibacteraceae bacterium]